MMVEPWAAPVRPDAFVAAMTHRWQAELHNVPNPQLQAVWRQIAETFNTQINAHGTPSATRWKVLQPATGTGKTRGLELYCSMLPAEDAPGVLIVTRLTAQADEIAANINVLAGREDVALAYHSDSSAPIASLPFFPVVVITHRAFEIGLDAVNRGQPDKSNWSGFMSWGTSGRQLVVIDEALDIVEEAQVNLDDVRMLRAVLPHDASSKFPREMAARSSQP